ncbi:MAG: hypothetical protein KGS61_17335 [Verrucomicrobia bacterium]|nr:hypothetical protein [Verrucomicrobiota bacterium]
MPLASALFYLGLCYVCGVLGKNRKFGFWGNFICCFVFTPLVGLIVLLASDERPPRQ